MNAIPVTTIVSSRDRRVPDRGMDAGFTLLELLVVVAIIALLLAILFPSFRKAREQALRVTCQSQLKQLAIAWHHYLAEHKGAFLQDATRFIRNADINYGGKHGTGPYKGTREKQEKPLNKYVGLPLKMKTDADVFHCPGDKGDPNDFSYYGTSYRMNRMLVGKDELQVRSSDPCHDELEQVSDRLENMNRSRVFDESRLLLMGDFEWDTTYQPAWETWWGPDWHGRRYHYNMAFLDGHAAFVHIRKGLHTTSEYTVIPFKHLQAEVCGCQEEVESQ